MVNLGLFAGLLALKVLLQKKRNFFKLQVQGYPKAVCGVTLSSVFFRTASFGSAYLTVEHIYYIFFTSCFVYRHYSEQLSFS